MAENKNDANMLSIFKRVMHITFCGRVNENSKCAEDCPVKQLNIDNWNRIRISDLIEVRKKEEE